MSNEKIFIEREQIMIKEKPYMAYFIKGKIRGKDVKISLVEITLVIIKEEL